MQDISSPEPNNTWLSCLLALLSHQSNSVSIVFICVFKTGLRIILFKLRDSFLFLMTKRTFLGYLKAWQSGWLSLLRDTEAD